MLGSVKVNLVETGEVARLVLPLRTDFVLVKLKSRRFTCPVNFQLIVLEALAVLTAIIFD